MTVLTFSEARDAIFGAIKTVWDAQDAPVFGATATLRFQNVEHNTPMPQNAPWGFCEMFITTTRQSGLRNDATRRYTTVGVVALDIYVPRHNSQASLKALLMGDYVRRALEGTRTGGVWYRNVTAAPAGQTAGFVIVRVMGDFEYTEEGSEDAE